MKSEKILWKKIVKNDSENEKMKKNHEKKRKKNREKRKKIVKNEKTLWKTKKNYEKKNCEKLIRKMSFWQLVFGKRL